MIDLFTPLIMIRNLNGEPMDKLVGILGEPMGLLTHMHSFG